MSAKPAVLTAVLAPIVFALAAAFAVVPMVAHGETGTGIAEKRGIFALLVPKDPQAAANKAARKAERQALRDAKKRDGAAVSTSKASASDGSRQKVKAAVARAIVNRPKGRLWCVPFARAVTGVEIRGNARVWWDAAKGTYARGHEPQVGAVMAFAASRAMPKGHVAVVSHVVSDREILVDQANWERNRITEDTLVVDVSDKGDWSKVKVASASGTLGRVNPVNGFIYN